VSGLAGARIRDAGEAALLIELGEGIDPAVHERVLALDEAINTAGIDGVRETVPSYRALLVIYDPERMGREALIARLDALAPKAADLNPREWSVPACFEGAHADDLTAVAEQTALDTREIIGALIAAPLRLYMYGFAPGFAYLGGLDQRLAIPRRATPRAAMPPGSLMIAGGQASIASVSMPTGWYVVGRTPVQMFSPERAPMVPFQPGDAIRLRAVSLDEFEALAAQDAPAAEPVRP
jgi:KipI family sensor histidine kinase inhibitor